MDFPDRVFSTLLVASIGLFGHATCTAQQYAVLYPASMSAPLYSAPVDRIESVEEGLDEVEREVERGAILDARLTATLITLSAVEGAMAKAGPRTQPAPTR